jgi:hypothetical protein
MTAGRLQPLFPWFGGKRFAGSVIWDALGDPAHLIVPFAGGLGDLLGRPTPPRREVINDLDCYVVNFWRAVQGAPEAVWHCANGFVSEVDLQARHPWLTAREHSLREHLIADPGYYDTKVAGWWVCGVSVWIGTGWCDPRTVHQQRIPRAYPGGIHIRSLADVRAVAARLRRTIVTCGDWRRVLTPAYLGLGGGTGIILDPPYRDGKIVYADQDRSLSAAVRAWALDHGDDPNLRIVLCGYEGEHELPPSWRVVSWHSRGGYGNQRRDGRPTNTRRERLWLSPQCLPTEHHHDERPLTTPSPRPSF